MYSKTVIQSTSVADFSFGFTKGSFLPLNGQKHLRSVPKDLISKKQKRTDRIYRKQRRHGHYKTLKPILRSIQARLSLIVAHFHPEIFYKLVQKIRFFFSSKTSNHTIS